MLTVLIAASLWSTAAWHQQDQDGEPRLFDVRVHLGAPAYPAGAPAVVNLEVVNISVDRAYLEMNYLGLPSRLELRLADPDGHRSAAQDMGRDNGPNAARLGPPIPPRPSDLYVIKPGERVSLRYDLARLFDLQRPGTYRLEISEPGGAPIRRVDFDVVTLDVRQKTEIEGFCEPPLGLFEREGGGVAPARCQIEIGQARNRRDGPWFATISGVMIAEHGVPRVAPPLVVPSGTRVEAHALDFRGQLWATLVSKDRSALIIWDLKLGCARTVSPWGKGAIEIGSTQARPGSLAKVVIAGQAGQAKLSTLDDGQSAYRTR